MRLFRAAAISLALVAAPTAEAGIGSLLKAAARLGKVGAQAGGKVAGGAKLAKGGAVLNGAKAVGAGVAARQVFTHAATDGARVGVFVADDGAGALRVVMQSGDELTHTPSGLRSMIGELDEMAAVSPEAGVDVFLDPDVLPRLAELEVGSNTRLWLANLDGPSLPLRKGADDVAEVAIEAPTGAGRIWFRVATESAQMALRIATMHGPADEVVVVDADCEAVNGARVAPDLEASVETAEGTVFVLTDRALGDDAIWLAQHHGIDLVVLGLDEVCPPDRPATPAAVQHVNDALSAKTYGELWAIGSNEAVVDLADLEGDWLHIRSAGLLAVHRVFDTASNPDEPPLWIYPLAVVISIPILWWMARRKKLEPA